MFTYRAHCYNVVDGDTVDLEIDLGFNILVKERFRLAGINTPEIHGVKKESEEYAKGMEAKREVERLILGRDVIVVTDKDKKGKYGRYIATVYTELEFGSSTFYDSSLNDFLVKEGFAEEVEY